jgi:glutamine phosphoribosylpyrophosphate amidotransferase
VHLKPAHHSELYYVIFTSIGHELIAAVKTIEEIRQTLGVDTLNYLSIKGCRGKWCRGKGCRGKGLLESVNDPDNQLHCLECFS